MDDDQGMAPPRAGHELDREAELAELHQRAKQVFFAILDCAAAERATMLTRLCQGDAALHREVASLLAHHRHDSLIPTESSSPRAPGPLQEPSPSPVGKQISGILVEREVGEGGMSTVYLGYDARLGRRVALKALRSHSELDRETRARLLREARVLSRLKHANICEIYGRKQKIESFRSLPRLGDLRAGTEPQTLEGDPHGPTGSLWDLP